MDRSYASPVISPNGRWIMLVGESLIFTGKSYYRNTDIYVCRTDGTQLTQLTFHAADDLSPVWSRDGRYIYFISQRGSADGVANVWRMPFTL
jgi:Tol biopolymer transport system component